MNTLQDDVIAIIKVVLFDINNGEFGVGNEIDIEDVHRALSVELGYLKVAIRENDNGK